MKKYKRIYRGESKDCRTNRWEFVCPNCKKIFEPETTMHSEQYVKCPRCKYAEMVNYNETE